MKTWVVAVGGTCILLGSACAPRSALDWEMDPLVLPTIAVTNSGMEPLKLHDRYGYVGRVDVGETRCFVLRHHGPYWLLASFNAYNSAVSPSFLPEAYDGWQWEIGTAMRYDALRLVPTNNPCKARGANRGARRAK